MNRTDVHGLNASLLADAMQRLHGPSFPASCEIGSLSALTGLVAVGPAYTVKVGVAREKLGDERSRWFAAIDNAPAGSIFVIQASADITSAVFGEMVALRLLTIGLVGAIVDGYSRDLQPIGDMGIPYWTRSVTMRGMLPDDADTHAGVELTIGGVTIRPGDMVAADSDGVVVCPALQSPEVLEVARTFRDSEVVTKQKLRAGGRLFDAYPSKSSIQLAESA